MEEEVLQSKEESKSVESPKNNLKFSLPSLAQLSALLIVLGLIKEYYYYHDFNVPIKYFIGISELALSIGDDLIPNISILVFSVIFTRIALGAKKQDVPILTDSKNNYKLKPPKRFMVVLWFFRIVMTYSFLRALNLFLDIRLLNISDEIISRLAFFLVTIFGFIIFLFFIPKIINRLFNYVMKEDFTDVKVFWVIGISIFMLYMLVLDTSNEILSIRMGKYKDTVITTSDTTYISNDSTYFIGKTEKYVFIYKSKESGTLVIPTESVKQMFIKSK